MRIVQTELSRIKTWFPILSIPMLQLSVHAIQRYPDFQTVLSGDIPQIPSLKIHIPIISISGTDISTFRAVHSPFTSYRRHTFIRPGRNRAQGCSIFYAFLHYSRLLHLRQDINLWGIHDIGIILILYHHSAVQRTILLRICNRQRQKSQYNGQLTMDNWQFLTYHIQHLFFNF